MAIYQILRKNDKVKIMGTKITITFDIFVQRAIKIHGNKYLYYQDTYINTNIKTKIKCNICNNIFWQKPNKHYNENQGCPKCANNILYTYEQVIKKIEEIFSDKFLYDKFLKYERNDAKFILICKKHGEFKTTFSILTAKNSKHGCPKCSNENNNKDKCLTKKEFILKSREIHGNKYDYSSMVYKNTKSKIEIKCNICNNYIKLRAGSHLNGHGCRYCAIEKDANRKRKTTEEFIKEAKQLFGNKYDYSQVIYKSIRNKIKIKCIEHNFIFYQRPNHHLMGNCGCPKCKNNKNEEKIHNFLKHYNINYEIQKIFPECFYKNVLRFDFYLPDYNLCIEYDGEQHYKIVNYWGGEKGLKERQLRDSIKNEFCKNNYIKLLRIPYWDFDNIEDILKNHLFLPIIYTNNYETLYKIF